MKRREFIATAGAAAALMSTREISAQGQTNTQDMHPPKYAALEAATAKCVANGQDCLRHCLGMLSMKDTSMATCTNSVIQLVAVCHACKRLLL